MKDCKHQPKSSLEINNSKKSLQPLRLEGNRKQRLKWMTVWLEVGGTLFQEAELGR